MLYNFRYDTEKKSYIRNENSTILNNIYDYMLK